MPFGRESRKISLGSKPHLLVGTMLGTLATFVVFVQHYTTLKDDGSGARHQAKNAPTLQQAPSSRAHTLTLAVLALR